MIGNVFKPLAKSDLMTLGLTAAASATDAVVHKKMFGLVVLWTLIWTLIISNEAMNDIMEIIKSL